MFRKLTLTVVLMIVLTSIGCVCSSGGPFGVGIYDPCGPCIPSYDCTPCGMSACDPVAPCEAACGPCEQAVYACEPAACEPCGVAACEPSACGVAACESACSCNPCDSGRCLTGFGLGVGSENGLFNSVGHGRTVRQGHGFNRAPEEMYVTRGPRDFFYNPNSTRMR